MYVLLVVVVAPTQTMTIVCATTLHTMPDVSAAAFEALKRSVTYAVVTGPAAIQVCVGLWG